MGKKIVKISAELSELMPTFMKNVKNDFKSLDQAFEEKDIVGAQKITHRLKGNAAPYGFIELGDSAKKMNDFLREESFDQAKEEWEVIKDYFDCIEIEYINEELK